MPKSRKVGHLRCHINKWKSTFNLLASLHDHNSHYRVYNVSNTKYSYNSIRVR
jgi:hypothetical protein